MGVGQGRKQVRTCHRLCVDVGGQPVRICSLLPRCGPQGTKLKVIGLEAGAGPSGWLLHFPLGLRESEICI